MTNVQPPPGYVYRVAKASAKELQAIIADHVGAGSIFGGAAQWDFDAKQGDKNLRAVESFTAATPVNVCGDFGHAFNKDIEVRWKRRDDDVYDVLVLSEKPQTVTNALPLCVPHWNSKTQSWEDGEWTIRRPGAAAIRQTAGRSPISYVDYLAPNGAVQFQRFVEVQ